MEQELSRRLARWGETVRYIHDRMPECYRLITEEAVREALKGDKGSEAQLTSWKIEDFTKKGDNYASKVTSVKVEFSLEGKENCVSYVVKVNPCHGFDDFDEITEIFFKKEAEFYTVLVPRLNAALKEAGFGPLAVPQCYHSTSGHYKELIFLEDLRPRGFKMAHRQKGLDKAHATLALKELARLHAASMLLQKKDPDYFQDTLLTKGWYNLTAERGGAMPLFHKQLESAIQLLRKVGGYDSAASWMEDIKAGLDEVFQKVLEPNKYQVVLAGDAHNNNLVFRYDDEGQPLETRLLDFQICRRESFAIDLNYLFYASLPGDVRKPNLEGFLEAYRSQFNAIVEAGGGEVLLEKEEVMKEFRSQNVFGAIFGSMITCAMLLDPEDVPDVERKGGEDSFDRIMIDIMEKILEKLVTHPLLRTRFLAPFDEMMEVGLIPT